MQQQPFPPVELDWPSTKSAHWSGLKQSALPVVHSLPTLNTLQDILLPLGQLQKLVKHYISFRESYRIACLGVMKVSSFSFVFGKCRWKGRRKEVLPFQCWIRRKALLERTTAVEEAKDFRTNFKEFCEGQCAETLISSGSPHVILLLLLLLLLFLPAVSKITDRIAQQG